MPDRDACNKESECSMRLQHLRGKGRPVRRALTQTPAAMLPDARHAIGPRRRVRHGQVMIIS